MIQVQGLRENNYYLFTGNSEGLFDFKDKIGQVKLNHIFSYYVEFKNISNEKLSHFTSENISPIPLTPDVLLKCGFIQKGDWFYKEYFILGFITTEDNFQTEYKMSGVQGDWKLLNIRYLHQLQNLYYALTSQELSIETNFK